MSRYDELKEELRRSPRTWLVTGAAGFIGSSLVRQLLSLGQTVVGMDNFATGYRRNLDEVVHHWASGWGSFRFVEGDVTVPESCRAACAGVDVVLHQAALASVPLSIEEPELVHRTNVDGTLNLLVAARQAGVKRVVYASSSAVYGNAATTPVSEAAATLPLSPYGASKLIDEVYAGAFHASYGLESVGLRYFNVFGPRQDPHSAYAAVIPGWIRCLLAGEPCHVNGDGETTRDFVSVHDVVQANLLAGGVPLLPTGACVFNVGAGRGTSLNALHALLSDAVAREEPDRVLLPAIHGAFRPGDIRHSQADVAHICAALGYRPATDLAVPLAETVRWYAARLAARAAPPALAGIV